MMRTRDVEAALHQGASYVGAIMAGGPRNLSLRDAVATLAPAMGRARRVAVVRVGRPEEVADVARQFDVIQLHGDVTPADVMALRPLFDGEIWSVVRANGSDLPDFISELFSVSDAVVLDKRVASGLGGTGESLDWSALAGSLPENRNGRTILAGGLTPSNVAEAIHLLHPDIVDVSSGVEKAPGIKN
ncbi:MAG: phosphoribosylanthranilate isomerase, partial [Gemmatimonadaceae bacterium]|nr:phosphoribosylanthranilate isomerase [Gemmatimonadaceae bacterium]